MFSRLHKIILVCIYLLLDYSVIFATLDHNLVKQVAASLSKLDNVAIEFTQIDQKGKKAKGKLLIKKPYHFRCNYYPPYPLLIVGGKKYVTIYDYSLETVTRLDTKDSITNILLINDLAASDNFKVVQTRKSDNYIVIKVLYLDKNQFSELFFDGKTLVLSKIKIYEMNAPSIVLDLSAPIKVKKFAKDLFLIPSPEIFGKPGFLKKEELEKKYESY